jgi:hypothetical protein
MVLLLLPYPRIRSAIAMPSWRSAAAAGSSRYYPRVIPDFLMASRTYATNSGRRGEGLVTVFSLTRRVGATMISQCLHRRSSGGATAVPSSRGGGVRPNRGHPLMRVEEVDESAQRGVALEFSTKRKRPALVARPDGGFCDVGVG